MRLVSSLLSRRGALTALAALVVIAPAARYAQLRWLDRSFPPVAEPELTIVNGWVLDAGDLASTDAASER